MKKITACLLLLILLPVLALSAAAEGFDYSFDSNSKALFMINSDTGKVVYSMNADERLPMASLTKIMSYIVAYENIPDIENTVIRVDESVMQILEATNSSTAGIVAGEELTGLQLLNLMMVCSGNDAALVLAQYLDAQKGVHLDFSGDSSEGIDARATNMEGSPFVALMNEKAVALGCENTKFTNPHGLYNPEHYSTAREMAAIAQYALTLPQFKEISSASSYTLDPTNQYGESRTFETTNRMMQEGTDYYYAQANGIKTGSLNESGYCIVAAAEQEGTSYIIAALGSPYQDENGEYIYEHGEMQDARTLFTWAFSSLKQTAVATPGDEVGTLPLSYCEDSETLNLTVNEPVEALLPADLSADAVTVEMQLPEKVHAPVKQGDIIGSAVYSYGGETLGTVQLVAAEDAERSLLLVTLEVGGALVKSPVALGIVVLVIAALVLVIGVSLRRRKRRRRRKSRY